MAKLSTVNKLAALVNGEVEGDGDLEIHGLNGIDLAAEGEITYITSGRMAAGLAGSRASACIAPMEVKVPELTCIRVNNPEYAAAVIHNHFLAEPFAVTGIDPAARVGSDCRIDREVSVGPYVTIGDRVRIEARVVIHPGVFIGNDSAIGEDTIIYPNVYIAKDSVVGRRVIIHAGVAIGSDGFGYATDPNTGTHLKKPQVGNVRIDDDVEIGANSCIDRAAFGTTRIREGTKIDNLVMIAHNVDVGENSILVAQVGIAGSTTLGRNVVLGGQAGIAGHLRIGDRAMVAARGGVHTSLKQGSVVGGTPAIDVKQWGRASAAFSRLPDMYKELRHLQKEIDRLTKLLGHDSAAEVSNEEKEQDGDV